MLNIFLCKSSYFTGGAKIPSYGAEVFTQTCSAKKDVHKSFTKFTEKHLCQSHFLKQRLCQRCFPAKFVKFLRKPFFVERTQWLLLYEDDATPYSVNKTKDLVIDELVEFSAVLFKCFKDNFLNV